MPWHVFCQVYSVWDSLSFLILLEFTTFGKFSAITSSKTFSVPFSLSFLLSHDTDVRSFVTPLVPETVLFFFHLFFRLGKFYWCCPQVHRLFFSVISIFFIIVFFSSIISIWFSHITSTSLLRFFRLFHLFEENLELPVEAFSWWLL